MKVIVLRSLLILAGLLLGILGEWQPWLAHGQPINPDHGSEHGRGQGPASDR